MRVLVTGASGFVVGSLIGRLTDAGHDVIASSRSRVEKPGIFYVASPELGPRRPRKQCFSDRLCFGVSKRRQWSLQLKNRHAKSRGRGYSRDGSSDPVSGVALQ